MMKAELYFSATCNLAEGPVWYSGLLWWVDIEAGRLMNSSGAVYEAGFSVGAALPCEDGRWLLAEEDGFSFWDLNTPPQRFWQLPVKSPDYRFNDAEVAPDGSVWAGSLKRGALEGGCTFYRLDPSLKVSAKICEVGLCNGMDWFGDRFYFADTGAQTVYVRTAGKTGVFNRFKQGYPDGLTVDVNGNVWVALWGEGRVVCLAAETGAMLTSVEVPAAHVSSCCFGGADLETLYITTARQGLCEEQLSQFPESGGLFCVRPGVKGFQKRAFNNGAIQ